MGCEKSKRKFIIIALVYEGYFGAVPFNRRHSIGNSQPEKLSPKKFVTFLQLCWHRLNGEAQS